MFAVEVSDQIMIAHSFRGRGVRSRPGAAWRDLRGSRGVPGRRLDANGIVVDIGRAHDVLKDSAGAAQLPQPRRPAAVQGHQHHHRIPDQVPVRSARRRGARAASSAATAASSRRSASPLRNRRRRAPGTRRRCGEGGRLRGAGRSCDADRRLCLRPPHHRGACGARLAHRGARPRRRLSASRAETARPRPARDLPRCRTARPIVIDGLAFGVSAGGRRGAARDAIRWSRWCIIRLRSKPGLERRRHRPRCARANARRSACARHVITTSPATARLLVADYDVAADRLSVVRPGTDRVATQPRRREGDGRAARGRVRGAAQGLRCAGRGARQAQASAWRLVIAGDRGRSPETSRRLEAEIARLGLADRITFARRRAAERARAALRSGRSVRAALALRGLRHGLCRGHRPRRAGGRHEGRCHSGDGAPATPACWCRPTMSRRSRRPAAADRKSRASANVSPPAPRAATFPSWSGQAALFARVLASLAMSGFSAEWLALREPYDRAARNATVLDAVAAAFRDQSAISVVDLACGTGATLRAIGPHLPPRQSWRLVDNDLSLLAQVATPPGLPQVSVIDQAGRSRPRSRTRARRSARSRHHSALLDLVSAEWLDRLVVEAAARRLPVYAALTYDGRTSHRAGASSMSKSWPASTCTSAPTRASVRRSGRARRRAPWSDSSSSVTPSCRAAPIGCSGPTIGAFRKRCSPTGPGWER